jgi:amino acid transporter
VNENASARAGLRRVLGTPLLVFYGLGVIIGAGIYVLVGSVFAVAGTAAPWSFVLAGVLAALTALSYAELASRFPEAAGAAAYVKAAFGSDRLSQLTGLAVAVVVVVSTASIARGVVGYLQVFLPLPAAPLAGGIVLLFTLIALLDVRESVGLAAAMTLIEIAGLLLVIAAGWPDSAEAGGRFAALAPPGWDVNAWLGVAAGMFLALFAFIGFENMANMAEEARDPERSVPRAILISLGLSTLLYAAVASIAVLEIPLEALTSSPVPLLLIVRNAAWFSSDLFAAIAVISVAGGVLIELVMLARLLYGMAHRGWAPKYLAVIAPRFGTPVRATLCGGLIVLVLTVTLSLEHLVALTSTVTLLVFALVNVALWRLQRQAPRTAGFRIPRALPPLAAAANVALAAASLLV